MKRSNLNMRLSPNFFIVPNRFPTNFSLHDFAIIRVWNHGRDFSFQEICLVKGIYLHLKIWIQEDHLGIAKRVDPRGPK
ncbi:hypothetical protein P8452_43025 [Trifolium repens]|nr:hypothetical protein P8452_43025 [Trifolium repens]